MVSLGVGGCIFSDAITEFLSSCLGFQVEACSGCG